jgi:hypothetical protein
LHAADESLIEPPVAAHPSLAKPSVAALSPIEPSAATAAISSLHPAHLAATLPITCSTNCLGKHICKKNIFISRFLLNFFHARLIDYG